MIFTFKSIFLLFLIFLVKFWVVEALQAASPFVYGKVKPLNVNLLNPENLKFNNGNSDDMVVYEYKVKSDGAKSIALHFNQLKNAAGKLFIAPLNDNNTFEEANVRKKK